MGDDLEKNKRIVRDYITRVLNTGDVGKISEYISPVYVEIYRNGKHQLGIDGARDHIRGVRETYPDLELTVERQIAEGEWVVTLITARGTHQGEWLGIKPTGKKVEYTGVNVDRIREGLIVEHGGAVNLLETLLEIGAVKVVGTGME
ncbi:MAG: ester cyclase [Candidatus Krumholzibacteriota bacterium]|nr:ester cyclase [Candidatus Krumholzibacteriota bacterium]